MKSEIALKLVADQLEWTDQEGVAEFRKLQLMVNHKYDSYQGFQPASRFHVALLNWLSQFSSIDDRRTAFEFLRAKLIFITQREMHHLVSLMMPRIDRLMRHKVATQLGIPYYQTWQCTNADVRLRLMRRRTLFVGLSDGARIDVFRRYNEGAISNEQVVPFSEISEDKWADLKKELVKSLEKDPFAGEDAKFEAICLVDDFAGSGSSLLRKDDKDNVWKGKIAKFYKANKARLGEMLTEECTVYVHHHLATEKAKASIDHNLSEFESKHPGFKFTPTYSYVLPDNIVITDSHSQDQLTALIKKYYDEKIEDEHTGKDIWYGYKQCGLPLVLEHNTPNNSVALIWAASPVRSTDRHYMKPLFARRKRHSSHG